MAKEQWGTRIGVILAVAGSAVGLGNFLRFPGKAAENGGGAFLLPYFIALLVLGIPVCWAEWTMGRYAGTRGCNSAPSIFRSIWPSRWAKYFGGPALMIPLVVYMYYVVIEAWCLGYAISYLFDARLRDKSTDFGAYFGDHVGIGAHGAMFEMANLTWLLVLLITFAINFMLIYRGISKGIELLCRFAMPGMMVLGLIVLVRVLTLGTPNPELPEQSVVNGLGFLWNPDPSKLLEAKTWLEASGQIFFTLSVGFGIIINYASYLRKDDDVVLSGLTACSMNEFFEICLGGLITVPAAFIFMGWAAQEVTGSSFALGFVAMPNVFAQMPGGPFFGFLWFFMLFIAAMTSSVSMLQPVIAFFEEGFGLKRHASALMLGLIAAMGTGMITWFTGDLMALDTIDFWVGSVLIFVLALIQAILYGWIFGIERGEVEAHYGAHLRIPRFVQYMLKYLVPVYLLAIFAAFCYQDVPSRDELLFDIDVQLESSLDGHRIPDHLKATLAEKQEVAIALAQQQAVAKKLNDVQTQRVVNKVREKYILPDDPQVTGSGTSWRIKDAQGKTHFTLRNHEQRILVNRHTTGRAEQVLNRPAALNSILFLLVLFAFMLGMIHLAGRRWDVEGKFSQVPEAR